MLSNVNFAAQGKYARISVDPFHRLWSLSSNYFFIASHGKNLAPLCGLDRKISFWPTKCEMELANEAKPEVLHSWVTPSCLVTKVLKIPQMGGGGLYTWGTKDFLKNAALLLWLRWKCERAEKWLQTSEPFCFDTESDVFHTKGKNMGFLSGFVWPALRKHMNEWVSVAGSDESVDGDGTRCTAAASEMRLVPSLG